jgi:hypothetical protein
MGVVPRNVSLRHSRLTEQALSHRGLASIDPPWYNTSSKLKWVLNGVHAGGGTYNTFLVGHVELICLMLGRWPKAGVFLAVLSAPFRSQYFTMLCGIIYRRFVKLGVSSALPTYTSALAQLSSAFHRGCPGSIPGQVMWILRWTMWHWGRFSPSTLVSPAKYHSSDRSTMIIVWGGTIGQVATDVPSGLSLIPAK